MPPHESLLARRRRDLQPLQGRDVTTHDNGTPREGWQLPRRQLADGCEGCGYSKVYCDSYRDISAEPCCRQCQHRDG
jgi:hypothetical protein